LVGSQIDPDEKVRKFSAIKLKNPMKAELTAILEIALEEVYWATCPEIPGANGQGETIEEAKESLKSTVKLIFEDRLADIRRGLPQEVIEEIIAIP
jgi:predicted RNase H-like HicB family nuclease